MIKVKNSLLDLCVNTLDHAKEKLEIYRANSGGEYQGGIEHISLIRMINETTGIIKAELTHNPTKTED